MKSMMKPSLTKLVLLAAAVLASASCSTVERESNSPPADRAAANESPRPAQTTPVAGGNNTAPPAAAPSTPQPAASLLPADQDLNLQANHANGSVLRATKVTFSEDSISLNLAITNGHDNDIVLSDRADMILRDNLGNRYNLAPPPQNPTVRVPEGSTLDGKFVFLGRINPAAVTLTLTTNDKFGGDRDFSNSPKMKITDIPVRR